jgi:site-specific recombinase XerD
MTTSYTSLAPLLERYFLQRLMQQRQASPHTISSYRDTFRMLLKFAQQQLHTPPTRLALQAIDAPLIVRFLDHLEKDRKLSARGRNLRLTAIHSFFRYAAFEAPAYSAQIQRVLAIPSKRFTRTQVHFLARAEVTALLSAPDQRTWFGRRDHAFLLVAAQTGLRQSEMSNLTRNDLVLGSGAHVRIIGKGRKERSVPLSKATVAVLKTWLREPPRGDGQVLFPNLRGTPLSADAVHYMLLRHVKTASKPCPSLAGKHVTVHVLRHYLPFLTMSSDFVESLRSFDNARRRADRVDQSPDIVFLVFYALQTVEETKQLVSWLISPRLAARRLCFRKGPLLHCESCFEINLRGLHRLMSEPQCNNRTIHTRL